MANTKRINEWFNIDWKSPQDENPNITFYEEREFLNQFENKVVKILSNENNLIIN